jgi:hypothetical protein
MRQDMSNVPAGTVTSTMIADGTIVNADINASAAIAGSKVDPSFVSDVEVLASNNATTRSVLLGPSDYATSGKYLAVQWSHVLQAGVYYTQGAFPHTFFTNNVERMRLDSSGRLGLGTSTPSARLNIVGSFSQQLILQDVTTNSSNKGGTFNSAHYTNTEEPVSVSAGFSTSTDNICSYGGGWSSGNAATTLIFYTAANNTTVSGTERLRIDSSGRVGIGTTSPGVALHVDGDIRCDGVYGETDTNTSIQFPGSDVITFN